jgi:pyruvate dehydrogenase E2 component (dihydrolipoamide acetyltransferase)
MPVNILMPALSPTMEKGKLAKWLKKEGDKVKSGDVLAEIETDKATMEVEAIDEGTLGKILVAEGTDDILVNAPIAIILGEGEKLGDIKQPSPPVGEGPKPAQQAAGERGPLPAASSPSPGVIAPSSPTRGEGRVFASPLARRVAKQKGIDLAALKGSGPHGRVVLKDVENAKPGAAPVVKSAALAQPMSDEMILKFFEPGSYDLVPHDGMRKTIARRLTESKQTIPHFYLTVDCSLENLVPLRERLNLQAPKTKDGFPAWKVSVNDFIIKALAMALMKVPAANASWTEAAMVLHKHSDVGVAVSIPGGLITPIIRKAETKGLTQISVEMKDYATRARSRKLLPSEYQGGSTAVSNLGMFGIKNFSAVINPPHGTILAVGVGERRPVVRGNDVVIEHQMSVTLSTDHRCVDGALGAELLSAFRLYIEDPGLMLV